MKKLIFILFLLTQVLHAQNVFSPDVFFRQNDWQQERLIAAYVSEKTHLSDSVAFYNWLSPLVAAANSKSALASLIELQCAEAQFLAARKQSNAALVLLKNSIQMAEGQSLKLAEADARHCYGLICLRDFRYKESVEYLLKANNQYEEIGWAHVPGASEKLAHVGELMQGLYTNDLGMSYFSEAGKYISDSLSKENFKLFLLTGWSYRAQKDTLNTRRCFQQCLKIGHAHNDKEMIATASGEIGAEYFIQKKYTQSEPYMVADYQNSLELGQLAGASNALGVLGFFDALKGNKKEALQKIRESEKLCTEASEADRLFFNCEFGVNIYTEIYNMLGDTVSANFYKKQFINLMEQKKRLRNDSVRLIEVEAKADAERYLRQFTELKESRKVEIRRQYYWIAGLAFATLAGFYIYFRERKRRFWEKNKYQEQEAQLIEEQRATEEELKLARQALAEFTQRIRDRNLNAGEQPEVENEQDSEHSVEEQLSELTILTDEEWLEFKRLFEQAHPDFFTQLEKRYPSLTPAENRLLALTQLDLSQRDMGAMLGVSPESVRKTRQRLRKKIDIREDELLGDWLKRVI